MARKDAFHWLTQINKASIVVNLRSGLLDARVAALTAKGLREVVGDAEAGRSKRVSRVIDYEPLLIAKAGPEVTILHAGRSSQDMHSTYRAAIVREAALDLADELDGAMKDLADLADRHQDTLLPAYTNGVAAQPTSFAHQILGYLAGFTRDRERLSEFYRRLNECPMGTTVLNGTGWPLDREGMSGRLGFDRPRRNAYDASQISMYDLPAELAGVVASIGLHIGEFVGDLFVQYAQPRPWILLQEGGENTYVSSAMPQKRNPGLLMNTRTEASDCVGLAMAALTRAHNVVSGMMDPKNAGKNAGLADQAVKALQRFRKVIAALVVNRARALEELNLDWTASQEIADQLMRRHGIPFRIGHHAASAMVTFARANNIRPSDFPYEKMREIYAAEIRAEFPEGSAELPMSEAEFRACLDPKSILEERATAGSASPKEVAAMLSEQRGRNAAFAAAAKAKREAIEAAEAALEAEFAKIA